MLEILNKENFENYIKNGFKLVLFASDICQYCIKQQPILNELSEKDINIGKVDAYKTPEIAYKYGITSFPTFILFKKGEILSQFSGFKTKNELLNIVSDYF